MTCSFAHHDGAYVLGALAPAERLELERHLAGCAECSRRVRELAGLTGLLARVPADVLAEPDTESGSDADEPPLPSSLLPDLVAVVRRERRRRRWAAAGLVAAATLVGVAVTGGVTGWGDEGPSDGPAVATGPTDPSAEPTAVPTAPARPMQAVAGGPSTTMTARVALTTVPWGTRVDLTCSYPATPDAGPGRPSYDGAVRYSLVVRTRDGGTQQVATWHGLPGETMHLAAPTATARGRIAAVVVRRADGSPVLQLRS